VPIATIITGFLLIVLGLVGYVGTGSQHPTALIPTYFGIALAIVGSLAKNPARRKMFMHIAVLLGLIGFLGTISGAIKAIRMAGGETIDQPEAAEAKAAMAVITLLFVGVCVASFIRARKVKG
jgi:multisubunit Na+/H+ antiporter MnhF subunit